NPLRATLSASFIQVPFAGNDRASLSWQSPDITKLHLVTAGDTIYNIARNEYGSESYYLQIAEANDLKNYRRLVPGTQLILPPVKTV
ncbi:MAG TPA: LysM domain-containing protein, partial [Bacteroidia bacterium]|nr:LysM domain-containing protein [Bacteroidia bacterium]